MSYVPDKKVKKEVVKIFNENFNAIFKVYRVIMDICHYKTER